MARLLQEGRLQGQRRSVVLCSGSTRRHADPGRCRSEARDGEARAVKATPRQPAKAKATAKVAPVAAVTPAANTQGGYTVKPGDTLAKIARANGISDWQTLYALNKAQIANPHLIYVGQHFVLS